MAILYTTNCPKCKVLEKLLNDKNISYKVVSDENVMIEKGFMSAPMLEIDGNALTFSQAMKRFL